MRIALIALLLVPAAVVTSYTQETPEDMVFVRGGCYGMGSDIGDRSMRPRHDVCVDDFHIDTFEVTQKDYEAVMGRNPSRFKGEDMPVNRVKWEKAREFCEKVGKRLPTEAEWEYAARGDGREQKWSGTDSEGDLGEYAWYRMNSDNRPHPVGGKRPNGLGLHDMSGNVWEWVSDYFGRNYYTWGPGDNPQGPERSFAQEDVDGSPRRVIRGGAFNEKSLGISVLLRRAKARTSGYIGFRCAMSASAGEDTASP